MQKEKIVSGVKLFLTALLVTALTATIALTFFRDEVFSLGISIDQKLRISEISKVEYAIAQNAGQLGVSDKRDVTLTADCIPAKIKEAKLIRKRLDDISISSSGNAFSEIANAMETAVHQSQDWVEEQKAVQLRESAKKNLCNIPELIPAGDDFSLSDRARGVRLPVTYETDTGDAYEYTRRLGYIPNYQKELFLELGWKVVITDEDLRDRATLVTGYDEDEVLWGLCMYYEKTIYLKAGDGANGSSLVHEMGHFMDFVQGRISYSEEFLEAYEMDKEEYEDKFWYAHLDQEPERYAEAYEAYYMTPTFLQEHCPNIYDYFAARL